MGDDNIPPKKKYKVKLSDIDPKELEKFKSNIISSAIKMTEEKLRQELDLLWQTAQAAGGKADLNFNSIAHALGIAKNHSHLEQSPQSV